MAFEDWTHDITDRRRFPIARANPYTGQPIDPEGLGQTQVSIQYRHTPTGKAVTVTDVYTDATAPALKRIITEKIDALELASASLTGPSTIDLTPQAPAEPSDASKAFTAYQAAKGQYAAVSARIAEMKVVADPKDVPALDQKLADAKTALDQATKALVPFETAASAAAADIADIAKP